MSCVQFLIKPIFFLKTNPQKNDTDGLKYDIQNNLKPFEQEFQP